MHSCSDWQLTDACSHSLERVVRPALEFVRVSRQPFLARASWALGLHRYQFLAKWLRVARRLASPITGPAFPDSKSEYALRFPRAHLQPSLSGTRLGRYSVARRKHYCRWHLESHTWGWNWRHPTQPR